MCSKQAESFVIAVYVQCKIKLPLPLQTYSKRAIALRAQTCRSRAGLAELAAAAQYVPHPFTTLQVQTAELLQLRTYARAAQIAVELQ